MARPRIETEDRRCRWITLRFSRAELAEIKGKADTERRSVSAYVRTAILRAEVQVSSQTRTDVALIAELKRIGVNLNQIIRAVNANGGQVPPELARAADRLDTVIMDLIECE